MQNLENKRYWIWLSLIPNLGVKKKQKLLEIYKNPEEIFKAKSEDLSQVDGIGENTIKNILDTKIRQVVDKHIEYMWKNKIDLITIQEKEYPELLKEIYDSPIMIYYKGNKKILKNKSLGIVGCRQASQYGKNAAKYFSYQLTKKGINIISGLAKGVDSYAHIGSICAQMEKNTAKACGKTIAVLGNGLDTIYPKENENLAQEIIKNGGAIISEYPLGTKPSKMNFPARNRIISGISKGILVIEAKEKSGTLITVDFALEQGRDVFVVPR